MMFLIEDTDKEKERIVVSTTDVAQNLLVFMKSAMKNDDIEVVYIDKYAPTVEYLVYALRKAFGWLEEERGQREVTNKRCKHSIRGICGKATSKKRCTEQVRTSCNDYEQADLTPFTVNYVNLSKVGGAKGL